MIILKKLVKKKGGGGRGVADIWPYQMYSPVASRGSDNLK